jgi:putative ABC transport system substrate-binding protein
MASYIRRRKFLATLLGGAAVAWPLAARAQQSDRMRRMGVLMGVVESDQNAQASIAAMRQALAQLGWTEGRNLRIDLRWAGGDRDVLRKYAAELVALQADIIVTTGSGGLGPLQQATRTIPIVFASVIDPVAGGFVASLSRPGGNTTGFTAFEYGLAGKWPELLKQIAPAVTRAAVLRDPTQFAGGGQLGAIQAVAPFFGMEVSPADVRNADEVERAIAAFARKPNGGLIVLGSFLANINRDAIIALAAQHRLPAVYPSRTFVTSGGLVSYGSDPIDPYRRAAGYIDRILKGEKPADLPVQLPTKYELVINLKTAKALALDIPATLLARADEVIE